MGLPNPRTNQSILDYARESAREEFGGEPEPVLIEIRLLDRDRVARDVSD